MSLVHDGLEGFRAEERFVQFIYITTIAYAKFASLCSSKSKHNAAVRKRIVKEVMTTHVGKYGEENLQGSFQTHCYFMPVHMYDVGL